MREFLCFTTKKKYTELELVGHGIVFLFKQENYV